MIKTYITIITHGKTKNFAFLIMESVQTNKQTKGVIELIKAMSESFFGKWRIKALLRLGSEIIWLSTF